MADTQTVSVTIPLAGSITVWLDDVDPALTDDQLYDLAADKVYAPDGSGLRVEVSDKNEMELNELETVRVIAQGNMVMAPVNEFTVERDV